MTASALLSRQPSATALSALSSSLPLASGGCPPVPGVRADIYHRAPMIFVLAVCFVLLFLPLDPL